MAEAEGVLIFSLFICTTT